MSEAPATALAVEQTIRIEAPRERVFALISDMDQLPRWMPATALEPRVGGRFEFIRGDWHAEGEVTEFEPPRVIAYTWDWRNQPLGVRTEVRWELEADGEATVVRLTHTGFRDQEQQAGHDHGWAHYGRRLRTAAEGGEPGPDDLQPLR